MKNKQPKKNQFVLTRAQIDKLSEITNHFKEVPQFTLEETFESGIGPTVQVKFNLFEKNINDTTVDITDVSNW